MELSLYTIRPCHLRATVRKTIWLFFLHQFGFIITMRVSIQGHFIHFLLDILDVFICVLRHTLIGPRNMRNHGLALDRIQTHNDCDYTNVRRPLPLSTILLLSHFVLFKVSHFASFTFLFLLFLFYYLFRFSFYHHAQHGNCRKLPFCLR